MADHPTVSGQRHDRDEGAYSLGELTDLAGVTVRTVRYYIAEGLLPPPVGAGSQARYTRQHLDRLVLIARMKDAFMPLKEIRRRMQGMTDAEIHDAARGSGSPKVAATSMPDSAADYIGRVLREQEVAYTAMPAQQQASRARSSVPPSRDAAWRRVAVTDEAELLIAEHAYDRKHDQIQAALDWLRRILNER